MQIPAILITLVFFAAGFCAPLAPVKDSIFFRVTREGFNETKDSYYPPYTAWWIDDSTGHTLRILFVTYYRDDGENLSNACTFPSYLPYLTTYFDKFGCPPDSGPQILPLNCPDYVPVDGITGCSERSMAGVRTVVTKAWDLKDASGTTVPPGRYTVYYNSVALDETYTPQDQLWSATFTLGAASFDSVIPSPTPLLSGRIEIVIVDSLELAFGGMSGISTDTSTGAPTGRIVNVTPPPPTAKRPVEHGFCGQGSGFSLAFLLFFIVGRKKAVRILERRRIRSI